MKPKDKPSQGMYDIYGMMTPQIGSGAYSIIIGWINEYSLQKEFKGWVGQ